MTPPGYSRAHAPGGIGALLVCLDCGAVVSPAHHELHDEFHALIDHQRDRINNLEGI